MKRWLIPIFVVFIFLNVSSARAGQKHRKGCNTNSCDRRVDRQWAKKHPMATALASWYAQSGVTASGHWAPYSVAHRTLAFYTKVRMCHNGCVTATVVDRGPFIAGREFDLTPSVKNAIGCGDLCLVRYRVRRR